MKYRNKVNGTIIDVDAEITGGVWVLAEAETEEAQEEVREEEAQEEVAQEEPEKEKPARKKKGQS